MTASPGDAGADTLPEGLQLLTETNSTVLGPGAYRQSSSFGHYATVIDTGGPQALALATDTIGTKALVAQAMGKFDTAGIDCVAMNANDIVCVGAEPVAMVDCVLVEEMEEAFLTEIAKGLREGARRARISIPGGETARVPEMLRGAVPGRAFDLGGTCAGLVEPDRILTGAGVAAGDALVGFASSGIHSNGLTLARSHLPARRAGSWAATSRSSAFARWARSGARTDRHVRRPRHGAGLRELDVRALFHVTGGGFLNLRRLEAEAMAFDVEALPPVPAIFAVIQRLAGLDDATMYAEYNMGAGFCAVVPEAEAERALALGEACGIAGWRLGTATASATREVTIRAGGIALRGGAEGFGASSLGTARLLVGGLAGRGWGAADRPAPEALFHAVVALARDHLLAHAQEVLARAPADLAGVAEHGLEARLPVGGHVDRVVGILAAGEEHLVDLVRGEAILLVARVVEPVAHERVDGVGGEDADVAVVAVVEPAAEGVPGHDHVGAVDADEAHDLAAQLLLVDGVAVGVAEEDALLHAQGAAGGALLLLADGGQLLGVHLRDRACPCRRR